MLGVPWYSGYCKDKHLASLQPSMLPLLGIVKHRVQRGSRRMLEKHGILTDCEAISCLLGGLIAWLVGRSIDRLVLQWQLRCVDMQQMSEKNGWKKGSMPKVLGALGA